MKYTEETLLPIVKECFSVSQVLKKLGLKQAGGTHHYISKKLKELKIDTSHFLGKGANFGQNHKGGTKHSWLEILVLRLDGKRQTAYVLRRALLESGVEYRCSECNINEWKSKILILHVDHKNGNWLDDRKENLRFLCPNCHSQSPKYCGSKGYTDITTWARGAKALRERRKKAEW